MSPTKKAGQKIRAGRKQGSLGWLEEIYFAQDHETAKAAFESKFPVATENHYLLQRPGEGQPVVRTDVEKEDGITYVSYSAPPFWEVPYQVLRLHLDKVKQERFIFHSGEELLTPLSGAIQYHLFWRDPKKPGKAPGVDVIDPLKPGSIIRINPELPHHAWSVVREGSAAWMVIRHLSNTGPSITLDKHLEAASLHPTPRRVKASELKDPGRFSLIAWGIAEKIKQQRDRSNLRIAQVAAYCGVDPSHLSRIENADTNVSLETLLKIGKFLHIDIDALIAPPPWGYDMAPLALQKPKEAPGAAELLAPPPCRRQSSPPSHFLHPIYWELRAGQQVDEPRADKQRTKIPPLNHPSSWIVLQGRVIMDIRTPAGSIPELAGKDSVIHLREHSPQKLQALEDTKLLQIVFSGECFCRTEP